MRRRMAWLAGAALAFGTGAAQAATISTLGTENTLFTEWGLPVADRFGQTVTLDVAADVQSFTFGINDAGDAVAFVAELFAWDGTATVGAALAAVPGITAGNGATTDYTAALGGVRVNAGQYALVFRATSPSKSGWAASTTDPYAGGAFVLGLAGGSLDNFEPTFDAAFAVSSDEVAPVPQPAALPFLWTALGSLGLVSRPAARRRRVDTA